MQQNFLRLYTLINAARAFTTHEAPFLIIKNARALGILFFFLFDTETCMLQRSAGCRLIRSRNNQQDPAQIDRMPSAPSTPLFD